MSLSNTSEVALVTYKIYADGSYAIVRHNCGVAWPGVGGALCPMLGASSSPKSHESTLQQQHSDNTGDFSLQLYARMLGFQALTFKDLGLEARFRVFWDKSSRTLLVLLSLITGAIWAVAMSNIHIHCRWSRLLCRVVEVICFFNVALQVYFQSVLRRDAGWSVPEKNKAYTHVCSLISSMIFILLLRDLEEVPGGTHDWMYACHGWAILFLQVTSVSAFHLHLLNLLAYWVVEAYLATEFGRSALLKSGVAHVFLIFSMCGLLPLAANAGMEMRSRRAFLQRHSSHPSARGEWLLGGG